VLHNYEMAIIQQLQAFLEQAEDTSGHQRSPDPQFMVYATNAKSLLYERLTDWTKQVHALESAGFKTGVLRVVMHTGESVEGFGLDATDYELMHREGEEFVLVLTTFEKWAQTISMRPLIATHTYPI
jgi:hypothetical protein